MTHPITQTQVIVYSDTNFEIEYEADTNLPEETIWALMDEAADEWYLNEEDEEALCFPLPEWIAVSLAEYGCKLRLIEVTSWYEPNYGF
jgi:hypothetical protein